MPEPRKAKGMIDFLREQIISGQIPPGGRVPPLRSLMTQFTLSFNTVKRGIDYLEEIGLVETRAQSGVYVRNGGSGKSARSAGKIAVFLAPEAQSGLAGIFTTAFLGIQKAAQELNWALELHFVSIPEISQRKIDAVAAEADGIILLAEYDSTLTELNAGIPVVGLCMRNNYNGRISLLDVDAFQAAELAVGYFLRHRLKKVIAVIDPQRRPAYCQRAALFVSAWQSAGGKAEIQLEPASFQEHVGYWFATGSLLQEALVNYRKKNPRKSLVEKHIVLSVDGKCLHVPDFEKVPTLAVDWQSIGRYAFQECLFRMEHPGEIPRRILLPVRLVEQRESHGGAASSSCI